MQVSTDCSSFEQRFLDLSADSSADLYLHYADIATLAKWSRKARTTDENKKFHNRK